MGPERRRFRDVALFLLPTFPTLLPVRTGSANSLAGSQNIWKLPLQKLLPLEGSDLTVAPICTLRSLPFVGWYKRSGHFIESLTRIDLL
jgi:hypothetical protein